MQTYAIKLMQKYEKNQCKKFMLLIKIYSIFFLCSQCSIVYPLPWTKNYTDKLVSALNIGTFLSNPLPLDNEKLPGLSDSIPYIKLLYLTKLGFLVNLTARKK